MSLHPYCMDASEIGQEKFTYYAVFSEAFTRQSGKWDNAQL